MNSSNVFVLPDIEIDILDDEILDTPISAEELASVHDNYMSLVLPTHAVEGTSFVEFSLANSESKVVEVSRYVRTESPSKGRITNPLVVGGETARVFDYMKDDLKSLNLPKGTKIKGYKRDPSRALEIVEKARSITEAGKKPAVVPCIKQLRDHYNRRPDKVPQEYPLREVVVDIAKEVLKDAGCTPEHVEAIDEFVAKGTRTWHDPNRGDSRLMHYQHERKPYFDDMAEAAMDKAQSTLSSHWKSLGVKIASREPSQITRDEIEEICTRGSAGEYGFVGLRSRNDPKFVDMAVGYLNNFRIVARAMLEGKYADIKSIMLDPLVPIFLKNEARQKKDHMDETGRHCYKEPDARIIFNCSPLTYVLSKYLYGDFTDTLMDKDMTFGPGYGTSRGRDRKIMTYLEHHFPGKSISSRCLNVNTDVEKWDANFTERHIEIVNDLAERMVDKSELQDVDRLARELMVEVHLRTLASKPVAHTAGMVMWFIGGMPSGHAQTSNFNTLGNCLVPLASMYHALLSEKKVLPTPETVASVYVNCVRSMGDNQVMNAELFEKFGAEFTYEKHKSFMAKIGLKTSDKETIVSKALADVGFCSRKFFKGPADTYGDNHFYSIRTWSSIISKIAAFPKTGAFEQLMYIRAMKLDCLGNDPVLHDILDRLELSLNAETIDLSRKEKAVAKQLQSIFVKLTGDTGTDDDIVKLAMGKRLSRKVCMSLQLTRETVRDAYVGSKSSKLGKSIMFGEDPDAELENLVETDPKLGVMCLVETKNVLGFLRKTGQIRCLELLDKVDSFNY
uniref:RNA-dependent RNA polymerase n=1 Tax=Erysiphe necator associated polymycovirus 7 TaxID=2742561 RepID=A0A8E3YYV3_9VIRU|nr:RNA-dependent RNA polymerase [Erysiphe necator associated polymycovirus 7]